MTIYGGQQLGLAISEALETPSYAALKGLRNCRWRIEHMVNEADVIGADNWARYGGITKRRLQMTCEIYGASHTAQARIREAALQGNTLYAKLSLASGEEIEGAVYIERYEEIAREDEMLEVEIDVVSSGDVTITV